MPVRASSRTKRNGALLYLKWRDEVKTLWYDWRAVGLSMKRSAPRDLFWLWDRVSSFIYKNTIELWVMETKNNQNVFSVFITHNSKIRELSYGNRVMKTELSFGQITFLLWVPSFLSYELWKLRIELRNLLIQTGSKLPTTVRDVGGGARLISIHFDFWVSYEHQHQAQCNLTQIWS